MTIHDPVSEAEHQIAVILRDLEKETGQLVESVEIRSTEVPNVDNHRRQLLQRVTIKLIRVLGHGWVQP